MWHLTCGDLAGDCVRAVLAEREPQAQVRVMRDDLAVGPLGDVDVPPCRARVAFWEALWPAEAADRPDFAAGLAADAEWLSGLRDAKTADRNGRPLTVTVWHGDSASEQLLLARVASALAGSEVALLEVACGTGDSRVARRRSVAMHSPQALAEQCWPEPVAPARRASLAAAWAEQTQADGVVRRWQGGAFQAEDFSCIDAALNDATGPSFGPLARAMADVMGHCDGFFPTDLFLYWRARELAAAGALELQGDLARSYPALSVRRLGADPR